jgi:hypothetical protein
MSPLIIFITLLLCADASLLDKIPDGDLPAVVTAFGGVLVFLLGVVLHLIYHLIYPYTFTKLQDAIFKKTYRTYLQGVCSISQAQSIRLFKKLRASNFFREDEASIYTDAVKMESAAVHALYFMSGASMIFFVVSLFAETSVEFYVFLIIAFLSLAFGLFLDKRYENLELDFVSGISKDKLLEECRGIWPDAQQKAQADGPASGGSAA